MTLTLIVVLLRFLSLILLEIVTAESTLLLERTRCSGDCIMFAGEIESKSSHLTKISVRCFVVYMIMYWGYSTLLAVGGKMVPSLVQAHSFRSSSIHGTPVPRVDLCSSRRVYSQLVYRLFIGPLVQVWVWSKSCSGCGTVSCLVQSARPGGCRLVPIPDPQVPAVVGGIDFEAEFDCFHCRLEGRIASFRDLLKAMIDCDNFPVLWVD